MPYVNLQTEQKNVPHHASMHFVEDLYSIIMYVKVIHGSDSKQCKSEKWIHCVLIHIGQLQRLHLDFGTNHSMKIAHILDMIV